MARKPKTDGERPAISQQKRESLMATARGAKKDIAEISGSLGEQIKTAVENNHLNRKVFRQIVALDRMEPATLRRWLEDFEHYLDISGLQARADSAPELPIAGEEDGEDNVKPFPSPTSVAAE